MFGCMKIPARSHLYCRICSMCWFALLVSAPVAHTETVTEHLHNQASEADSTLSASADQIPTNPARKIDELWIGIDRESYLARANPPAGIKDYTFLSGRLRTRTEDHVINGAIDVGGSCATSIENYSFLEMPEAYLNWRINFGDISTRIDEANVGAAEISRRSVILGPGSAKGANGRVGSGTNSGPSTGPGSGTNSAQNAGEYAVSTSDSHGDGSNQGQAFEISVGRRRQPWSTLDENWGFGLWQPVNRFDGLHPTEQGLAGIFAALESNLVSITAFVSPLFIPEQGATFEVSNGNFESHNPWFSKPPNSVELFPSRPSSRLNFELQTPSTGSVINRWSEGILLQVGAHVRPSKQNDIGAFLRASFIHKPRNALATPFGTTYILADTESYGNVVIYPRVEFQRLEAVEFGYRTDTYSAGFSFLRDEPENQGAPVDTSGDSSRMSYQTLKSEMYFSPYFEWRAYPHKTWGPRLRLMALNTVGGETQAQGLLASSTSLFGYRTPYRRAVSLQEDSMLWREGNWRWDQTLRLIDETEENGSVLEADVRLSYTNTWRFALSADILGSGKPDTDTSTFLARFRGNDNVSGHLTYIF